ncbi:MAG: hypothetical protein HC890_14535 [Chloroflexaceae bacterium]|nr:hypothetical protein [Chloroflexaceae bacterium]
MLCSLAGVGFIVAVLAHQIPPLQFAMTLIAVILLFAFIVVALLLMTGKISPNDFNQFLVNFLNALPLLKPNPKNSSQTQLPDDQSHTNP